MQRQQQLQQQQQQRRLHFALTALLLNCMVNDEDDIDHAAVSTGFCQV
jgi:uncharacterized membrane-anchored protein YhcB (DUF1043 family)